MTIAAGERFPDVTVEVLAGGSHRRVGTAELLAGRRVVLFGVPGAFTPGCSEIHLPGYLTHADALAAAGIEGLLCMSVNDRFVMAAWGEAQGAGRIELVADGNGELTRALGLEIDAGRFGMGLRCRRFAAVVADGVVERIDVEPAGGVTVSGADAVLRTLRPAPAVEADRKPGE